MRWFNLDIVGLKKFAKRGDSGSDQGIHDGFFADQNLFGRFVNHGAFLGGLLRHGLRGGIAWRISIIAVKRRLGFYINDFSYARIPYAINDVTTLFNKVFGVF